MWKAFADVIRHRHIYFLRKAVTGRPKIGISEVRPASDTTPPPSPLKDQSSFVLLLHCLLCYFLFTLLYIQPLEYSGLRLRQTQKGPWKISVIRSIQKNQTSVAPKYAILWTVSKGGLEWEASCKSILPLRDRKRWLQAFLCAFIQSTMMLCCCTDW